MPLLDGEAFVVLCITIGAIISVFVVFTITPKFKGVASVFPAEKADQFGLLQGRVIISEILLATWSWGVEREL